MKIKLPNTEFARRFCDTVIPKEQYIILADEIIIQVADAQQAFEYGSSWERMSNER